MHRLESTLPRILLTAHGLNGASRSERSAAISEAMDLADEAMWRNLPFSFAMAPLDLGVSFTMNLLYLWGSAAQKSMAVLAPTLGAEAMRGFER